MYYKEMFARWRDFLRFTREDLSGMIPTLLVTTLIFGFDDGRESFNAFYWLSNFLMVLFIVALALFFKVTAQKAYALKEGYNANFKPWWGGLFFALFLAIVTKGKVPLVFFGYLEVVYMIRQRLGEFRPGFTQRFNAYFNIWGPLAGLILAILFAIGLNFFPQSRFFYMGMIFNLIFAVCATLPLPNTDGLFVFYGMKLLYFANLLMVIAALVLLLTRTTIGLIVAIIVGLLITGVELLTGYNK